MGAVSEHVKERVYVGAIMASYVTGAITATLAFVAGLIVVIAVLVQGPDLCWIAWGILIGAIAILVACFVLGLLGGILGLVSGGLGALLQLITQRMWLGLTGGGLIGATLGWLCWVGLDALVLWLFDGEEEWRVMARGVADAPLVDWIGGVAWSVTGLLGGGVGAFHVVLFQQVFDRKSRPASEQKQKPPPVERLPDTGPDLS